MRTIEIEILEGLDSLSDKVKNACNLYKEAQQEITQLKKERDAYRAALKEIEDPTSFIQARADAEGKPMDGQRALKLSFDPVYLRGIATGALKQFLK